MIIFFYNIFFINARKSFGFLGVVVRQIAMIYAFLLITNSVLYYLSKILFICSCAVDHCQTNELESLVQKLYKKNIRMCKGGQVKIKSITQMQDTFLHDFCLLRLINTSLDKFHGLLNRFQQYLSYPLFHVLLIARNQTLFRKVFKKNTFEEYPHKHNSLGSSLRANAINDNTTV